MSPRSKIIRAVKFYKLGLLSLYLILIISVVFYIALSIM